MTILSCSKKSERYVLRMCSHGSECRSRDSRREISGYPRIWRPGSDLVVKILKIQKIIDFQSALFGLKIGLDELCMSISHGAASFAMGII
jgi:hypothetical protein